jgi:hypothetical protein
MTSPTITMQTLFFQRNEHLKCAPSNSKQPREVDGKGVSISLGQMGRQKPSRANQHLRVIKVVRQT